MKYEAKHERLLSRRQFTWRVLRHLGLAGLLVLLSLAAGITGYMQFEKLAFLDALLNAAMLLGGMGPVNPPQSDAGKIFASLYALYAGLVFIVSAALLLTPVLHRLLHRFHWSEK